jgi:hypothetical protein
MVEAADEEEEELAVPARARLTAATSRVWRAR